MNTTAIRLIVRTTALVIGVLAAMWLVQSPAEQRPTAQSGTCVVTTAYGTVAGAARGGACAYLGVPYAAPPVGDLRWRPPRPRAPWAPAALPATTAPPACPQFNMAGAAAGQEDCLTVNIWTPMSASATARLPVLVFLHPGSFLAASSNLAAIDGQRFAQQRNAIVVVPNYRVGPFGFLAHSALTMEDPGYRASGNYGIADQRAALGWVRETITSFGGDPEKVTLAGTSAGGISTTVHLVSPASRGLFQRAIVQSGFGTSRLYSAAEGESQGEAFAAALGCTDRPAVLTCLRSKTPVQVLMALPLTTLTGGFQQFAQEPGRVIWAPIVDGVEVPDQPRELFQRGLFTRIPIVLGTNRDEGWTFVDRSYPAGLTSLQYETAVRSEFGMDAETILRSYPATAFATPKEALARLTTDVEFTCEARRIARAVHHDGAPVYVYSFEYSVDPVNPGRAYHGLESNLIFGNNFGPPTNHVLAAPDLVIYETISTFWRRFADTGDPNPAGRPVQWPSYRPGPYEAPVEPSRSDRHFVFADRLGIANYLRDASCNLLEPFNFRSVLGAVPAATR